MRITLLGTGTAVPVAGRFPSGVLVQEDSLNILVDLGPGVLRRLPEVGLDLDDVDVVLLTHFHPDHCADLVALLFGLRNARYQGRNRLRIFGGRGLETLMTALRRAWGPWFEPRDYELDVTEIGAGSFRLGSLTVGAVAVDHRPESLAYRFTAADGALAAVSGDSGPCDGLEEVARGADLFVCECALPDALAVPRHLTPGLAARAAALAGVNTLCLTHFYPECVGHDLGAQARAHFEGRLVLGTDLMAFELGES